MLFEEKLEDYLNTYDKDDRLEPGSKIPDNPHKYNRDDVINSLKPIILHIIEKLTYHGGIPSQIKDDLFSVGLDAANEAIRTQDKDMGRFKSYAYMYIQSYIKRALKYYRDKRGPVGSYNVLKHSYDDANDHAMRYDMDKILEPDTKDEEQEQNKTTFLKNLIDKSELNEQEELVMLALSGIRRDGSHMNPKTSKEIADAFGVSTVRVSQIRKKAISKLKNYVDENNIKMESKLYKKLFLVENVIYSRIQQKLYNSKLL